MKSNLLAKAHLSISKRFFSSLAASAHSEGQFQKMMNKISAIPGSQNFNEERMNMILSSKLESNFNLPVQITTNNVQELILVKGNTCKQTQYHSSPFTRIVISEFLSPKDAQYYAFMDSARMFLMNFPLAGGCSVLKINPQNHGLNDQESIMRRYCLHQYNQKSIGAAKGIYYPSYGATENNMSKLIDTLRTLFPLKTLSDQASVCGKTHNNNGIVNRKELISIWYYNAMMKCLNEPSVVQKASMNPISDLTGKKFIFKV